MTEPRDLVRKAGPVMLAVLLFGCGGEAKTAPAVSAPPSSNQLESAPAPAPTSAPAPAGPGCGDAPPASPVATPPPPPPPPAAAPSVVPPADEPMRREALRVTARAELDRAQRDLEAAASDCEAACRALASMERATTHLCSLADQDADRRRCDDARGRLAEARKRVRGACGTCP